MRTGYLFPFVVFSALHLVSTGDSPVLHNVHGFVGGSVHMRCELQCPHKVSRLYFQKTVSDVTELFINGFGHSLSPHVLTAYKNRTIINQSELSMEMLDLSPTDEGEYTCVPFVDIALMNKTRFHLTVTANYSVPIISVQGCGNGLAAHNCVIGCSSSGGFPRSNVTWGVVGDTMSRLLTDKGRPEFVQDKHSHLWNVSHSVTLNCSSQLNISCSVGGAVLHTVIECLPPDPPDFTTLIAFAVLLLLSIALIVIVVIKCRRPQRPAERSTDAELMKEQPDSLHTLQRSQTTDCSYDVLCV